MINGKPGRDELYWRRREAENPVLAARVAKLVEAEAEDRLKIWLRVRLGNERKVDVARDYGYRDGSAVLQILKRLEERAETNHGLKMKLNQWKLLNVSGVQS